MIDSIRIARTVFALLPLLPMSACATKQMELSPCLRTLRPEKRADREARLRVIEEHRVGPAVLVHRGMWAAAPENTLEAYAAAADFGANGLEIDIRRTADGVLVCFHDDFVDRLLYGFGSVDQMTFAQLQQLRMRPTRPGQHTRVPTLAAVLELARRDRMLLFLDIKEPGLDADIAALLEAGHLWPHIVFMTPDHAGRLLKDPSYRPLSWKPDAALYLARRDMNADAVREVLERPGEMLIVDDPRVCAWAMRRWTQGAVRSFAAAGCPTHAKPLQREFPDEQAAQITRRAEHALTIELAGRASEPEVDALLAMVRAPGRHGDWHYHGLDAAAAVRALAAVGATRAVPELIAAFERVDPSLAELKPGWPWGDQPVTWLEFRLREAILAALGELRTPAGKAFLERYLSLDDEARRALGPPYLAVATRALLEHELSAAELDALLTHEQAEVRGTTIVELVDAGTAQGHAALQRHAPWALQLPSVGGG